MSDTTYIAILQVIAIWALVNTWVLQFKVRALEKKLK